MQLFQPCSSPEQSKAIADLSSGLGGGSGMTLSALSTGGGFGTDCALSMGGGSGTFSAMSTAQGVGRGSDSGTTFCAQPATAQASAIESLSCTKHIPVWLSPSRLTPAGPTSQQPTRCGAILPCRHNIPVAECNSDSSGGVTSMEAKIDTATQDLDAFSQGGPAMQAPTAITDRMHALLVTRADALDGCTEGSPEEAELTTLADAIEAYEAARWPNGT